MNESLLLTIDGIVNMLLGVPLKSGTADWLLLSGAVVRAMIWMLPFGKLSVGTAQGTAGVNDQLSKACCPYKLA